MAMSLGPFMHIEEPPLGALGAIQRVLRVQREKGTHYPKWALFVGGRRRCSPQLLDDATQVNDASYSRRRQPAFRKSLIGSLVS